MVESRIPHRVTPFLALLALLVALSLASCRAAGQSRDQHLAAGDRYVKAKQYPEAIIEYRNAIAKDSRYGPARMKLAGAYWENKDPLAAAAEYLKAAEIMPHDTEAQLKKLKMLLLSGRLDEVREESEKILEKEPKNVTAHLLHANAMAGLKEYGHALAEIRQAILLDPTNSGEYYVSLGAVQLLANNPEEAEAAFRMGAAADPNSVPAQLVQAANDWAHGRMNQAELSFKRTLALDPTNPAANRALAVFYMGSNREGEAEKHLLAYVDASPTTPVRLTLADYYIKMKRFDDATKVLKIVEKDREGFGEARSRLAIMAYDAGRQAEGHKILDETLARDPNSVPALLMKANFLIAERRTVEALPRLKAAAIAGPRSIPAHYGLGLIYNQEGNTSEAIQEFKEVLKLDPQSTDAQLALARLHLANGEPLDAIGFADQATKVRPKDPQARALLIRALIAQSDVKRAVVEAAGYLADYPQRAEANTLAGTVSLLKREPAAARQAFDRALALDPDAVEPLDGIIGLELTAGNGAKARALVEQRLALRPDNQGLLLLAARTYYETKEFDKAVPVLQKALVTDRANPSTYMLLGQVYLAQHQTDRALAEFEEMSKRDPKSVPVQTMIGLILEMQNKPAEAQKAYEKILAIDPRAAVAANNLAWLYATQGGNLDLALELARVAVGQMPQQAVANDTLGWVFYKKGLTSEAISPLEIAVSKDPRNPLHRYHLGLAYARIGEAEHARDALNEALRLQPNFDGAVDARRVLASLTR